MKKNKSEKAITTVSLIITIVVLVIVASITIGAIQNNGIIDYAKNAGEDYEKAQANKDAKMEDHLAFLEDRPSGSTGNKEPEVEELVLEELDGPWSKVANAAKNGGYDSNTKVNMPKLGTELTAIVLDTDKEQVKQNKTWYSYEVQTGKTQSGGTSKWANAVTIDEDGKITGYYVWIPRYAYKITSGYHKSTTGTIEIKFLKDNTNKFADGTGTAETDPSKITYTDGVQNEWLVHPAFQADASIGGGFGTGGGITGLWVAKFEISAFIDAEDTSRRFIDRSLPVGKQIKLMSIPGVESACIINIGEMFKLSYDLNRNADSHMLKNSEWGAVAYLAHSSYGRNKTEITINSTRYAGQGSMGKDTFTGGSDQAEGYLNNGLQSTTGNAYGIYDLNGGRDEYVAGYLVNSTFSSFEKYVEPLKNAEAKYRNEYTEYSKVAKGDAVYETSSNSAQNNSWFFDSSAFISNGGPFFMRGGLDTSGNSSGAFCFSGNSGGSTQDYSFRVAFAL